MPGTPLTDSYRNEIENDIVNAMLEGLDNHRIDMNDYDKIKKHVLDNLDGKVLTHAQMYFFLEDLVNRWPIFNLMWQKHKSSLQLLVQRYG